MVFTNGCFDILHIGHITLLEQARRQGDRLIVALNSDESVRQIKGPMRPIVGEQERARILAALSAVDAVVLFDESTPLKLIEAIRPDVLVKGGDYSEEAVVGAREVRAWGGRVELIPLVEGISTTRLIAKARPQRFIDGRPIRRRGLIHSLERNDAATSILVRSCANQVGDLLARSSGVCKPGLALHVAMAVSLLVIRLDGLGDVVLTTPLFRELKRAFPGSHCTVVVQDAFRPLLVTNPHIDEIIGLRPLTGGWLPARVRSLLSVLWLLLGPVARQALRRCHLSAVGR